jgi:hypothetical protein
VYRAGLHSCRLKARLCSRREGPQAQAEVAISGAAHKEIIVDSGPCRRGTLLLDRKAPFSKGWWKPSSKFYRGALDPRMQTLLPRTRRHHVSGGSSLE